MFYRIYPNWRGFLGKIGVVDGKMREKWCLLSGAAARTGSYIVKRVYGVYIEVQKIGRR